jgi:NAD+ synthase (glutamine-hydrolysing)
MQIFLAQQNYHIGHFQANTDKIIAAIEAAKQAGADLVVFSELSVCGYPPRDFLEFKDFVDQCYACIDQIAEHTVGVGVIVGAPDRNPVAAGKDLFNAAYLIADGRVEAVVHKTLLPTYDVFDEYRYFEPASTWQVVEFRGKKLAITICEDIWNLGDNPLYRICPMDQLMPQQPDVMINISASPFDYTHGEDRKAIISANVRKYRLPMVYCNAVGSQTELVFDGGSLVFDAAGNCCGSLPVFEEALAGFHLEPDGSFTEPVLVDAAHIPPQELEPPQLDPALNIKQIYTALVAGIRDYFQKMGFTKAILGSSGGIDSAVTQAIASEALGSEHVTAVLLPSGYSTSHSVSDAEQLCRNLGNPYHVIPIEPVYQALLGQLAPVFGDRPFSVAEENLQSRSRGNLLMGIANKFGMVLLNTSNKSELATGYGTLYGDMAGGLGVLGDCYKQQVYALAQYINREQEVIPSHILTKAPSAELRPNQKDADSLPDYAILDAILYQYIERRQGPREIKAQGFDAALVDRVLKLVNTNEYKRNQFCPIIRVSPKAFGVGRRLPIVAHYLH